MAIIAIIAGPLMLTIFVAFLTASILEDLDDDKDA